MGLPLIAGKKLIVFDLDGTITPSKAPMDAEMAELFRRVLDRMKIAVITGGGFERFEAQFQALRCTPEQLSRFFFFPTTGTRFYRNQDGAWVNVYSDEMSIEDRQKIKDAFAQAYRDINYHDPDVVYGNVIEDRGTQVTFSACGQEAPLEAKEAFKARYNDRRIALADAVRALLPDFEVKVPGVTSIDVTPKGIDKGYGIEKMQEHLGIAIAEMVFVGDALYEGGNDHPVIRTGIETVAVKDPEETKAVLRHWLAQQAA
jgi:HAD superfamily hydrolase (TIGR01484 family)